MSSETQNNSTAKALLWTGRVMSALPVLMMLMGAVFMFVKPETAKEGMAKMGYPESTAIPIVIAELVGVILYVIPQTSVLGAILLTGYLGGATATHVRLGEAPTAAVIVGILVCGGLFLRDARIRALIPLTRKQG